MENAADGVAEASRLFRQGTEHIKFVEVQDRVLADYLPQMIWIVRASDRHLLYANPRFLDYVGDVGSSWVERAAIFHDDDLKIIGQAFETVRRHGSTPEKEVRIRGRDARFRWHKIMLVPVTSQGEIVEWIVTALDVDEMVSARQELQEATDLFSLSQKAAGAGSWNLDLRTGAVTLSRESSRLHGIADEIVELNIDRWRTIVDADDAKTVLEALQAAVEARTTYNGEFRVRMNDGSVRWISGTGRAYYDENGDPIRMIGLNFDVTERKTAEAKLLEAKAEAEQARGNAERASGAKSDFLASMSHEIRTPLNSIIGYADLLMEDAGHGSPLRRKLEVIQESGAALLTVVNDILDFSKIEAGQVKLTPVPFSLRALVENVVSMLSGQAHRKGIAIIRDLSSNVPEFVLGDESRIRQILLNLVTNAVKFTHAGRVTINVARDKPIEGHDEETIRFAIRDTGIGISSDEQKRLFQRFSQVDGSISRKFGGTGLGLAICKQLVDLMRGDIGVESRAGDGAVFWFRVPLPLANAPELREAYALDDRGSARRARLLLVEDVVVNQDLAKAVLERAGHLVDVACNGVEAVEAVRSKPYDVVLMDVQMPVMDGITATQTIRASDHARRTVPIIAMTANVLPQQVAALKMSGMDDHVGKPFRRPELLAAIERWIRTDLPHGCNDSREDEAANARFDHQAFGALEDMLGEASFRVNVAKFAAELTMRFPDLSPSCDRERLSHDAHGLVLAAGLFGFTRLLSILRRLNEGLATDAADDGLMQDLKAERTLVLVDLDRHLMSAGGLVQERSRSGPGAG